MLRGMAKKPKAKRPADVVGNAVRVMQIATGEVEEEEEEKDPAAIARGAKGGKVREQKTDSPERNYSPSECTGTRCYARQGRPDPKHISTSHVERQNLTMRMHMRRFTRLTNGFSKKFENHMWMVALYTVYYNFVKIHKSLRVTPAMEAKLTDRVWTFEDIVELIDGNAPKLGPRGPYKKRAIST